MALTTSMTRSRRAEGVHLPTSKVAGAHRLLSNAKDHYAPRPKRQLDPSEREFDNFVAKKSKFTTGIAVEIPARSSLHARFAKDTADAKQAAPAPPKPAIAAPKAPTSLRAPPANGTGPAHGNNSQQQHKQQPGLTKHQEKVSNGLKHELNRLQPTAADTKEQGRKLRSQEATRFKSELSAYFPEYDEVIGNDPKETHLLNVDTPIIVIPDLSPPNNAFLPREQQHPSHLTASPSSHDYPVRSYADSLYTDLFDAQRIDFSFLNKPPPAGSSNNNNNNNNSSNGRHPEADPLPDSLFCPAHKKAERMERSIRNTEKGRAQHEKDQIIRLLDGLQGHDWLRVMGVSGVTESKRRTFEPARQHFIRGCGSILGKFRRWAREEKRRRVEMMERRAAAHEDREDEGSASADDDDGRSGGEGCEDDDEGHEERRGMEAKDADADDQEEDDDDEGEEEVEGEPPDQEGGDSDVDASIAKQLREEALAAAAKRRGKVKGKVKAAAAAGGRASASKRGATEKTTARGRAATAAAASRSTVDPEKPQEPPKIFTSFFEKRYQRDAALSRNRRKGRNVLAWGQPVPDMVEAEFQLPAELCDEETLRAHARKKRRDKRVRK
ncbi:something about silencing, SAS, complex subunit 4-domain-containing protein [Corynascus similis CBS 632.67]